MYVLSARTLYAGQPDDVAMDAYLVGQGVQYTSLDPVRFGKVGDRSASIII
jgi:hypothetical protein